MKNLLAGATALLSMAGFVSPAMAGWGGVEWGDSITAVRDAYPAGTEAADGFRVQGLKIAGFPADSVIFSFQDGRLTEIRMVNIHMNPTNMKSMLASQLGNGSTVQAHRCDPSRDCFETIIYVDRAKGNSIRYEEFFSRVSLTYGPIASSF